MNGERCKRWLALALVLTLGCEQRRPHEGKSIAELQKMLHDPEPSVRVQGAFGLSTHGEKAKEAVGDLIPCLHGEPLLRQNAVLALGKIGTAAREAESAIADLLEDVEWPVRRQAAIALGEIGTNSKKTIGALQKLRKDGNRVVRQAAEEALRKINQSSPR